MKKIFFVFILITCFLSLISYRSVQALESSKSATASTDLKSKLKSLQDQIASKAANLKLEVGKKLQNRAYIGTVRSKTNNNITLVINQGGKIVNINEYTEYLASAKTGKGKIKSNLKGIAPDDYIVALGDVDDNDVMTAKKVIKLLPSKTRERRVILGQVTTKGNNQITVQTSQNQNITLTTDSNTDFQFGKTLGSFSNISTNGIVVAIGENSGTDSAKARFIYIVSKTEVPIIKPATSSATQSASPSAKPTTKPKT